MSWEKRTRVKSSSARDDETRFWIAQEVAETEDKHDARQLFIQARRLMGKQPRNFITDGLQTYSVSASRIFPNAKHILTYQTYKKEWT